MNNSKMKGFKEFTLICIVFTSLVLSLPIEERTDFPILQPPSHENEIISEENDEDHMESSEDGGNQQTSELPLGPTSFPILTPSDPPMANDDSQESDLQSDESTIYPILTPSNPPVNDEPESDLESDESTIYPILIPQQECKKLKKTCKAKGNKGRECEEFKEKCGSRKSSRKGVKNGDGDYEDCDVDENGDCDEDYFYKVAREGSAEEEEEYSESEESDEQGPDIDGLSQCVNGVMTGGNSSSCPSFIG